MIRQSIREIISEGEDVNNDEKTDMSVLMTMLNKNETCVLGYGKDLKFYEGEPT